MNERGELARVGDLIDVVLGKVAQGRVAPVVRLRRSWHEIAGEWAERCRPAAVARGVVTLEVETGMDASLLRYAVPTLQAAMDAALGGDPPIRRVAVRVRAAGKGQND